MEPDYENMNDRVMRLPIAEELKQDMVDGITYCKKFSVRFTWNNVCIALSRILDFCYLDRTAIDIINN